MIEEGPFESRTDEGANARYYSHRIYVTDRKRWESFVEYSKSIGRKPTKNHYWANLSTMHLYLKGYSEEELVKIWAIVKGV